MKRMIALVLLISAIIIGGFELTTEQEFDTVGRVRSPNAKLEAVHATPKTGATVGFVDWIYIVKAGEAPTGLPSFVADQVDGELHICWHGDNEIRVTAKSARIFKADATDIDLPGGGINRVEIQLDIINLRKP